MKKLPQMPDIPEEEQTPLVKALLGLLEQYSTRIVVLEETKPPQHQRTFN